jgi:hypothetical protein
MLCQVFIDGITSILAKFECIQCLFVMPANPYGVKWSQFHNEYEILHSWSQKCPLLKLCKFPSGKYCGIQRMALVTYKTGHL